VFLADAIPNNSFYDLGRWGYWSWESAAPQNDWYAIAVRHGSNGSGYGTNVAYADGHVEYVKKDVVQALYPSWQVRDPASWFYWWE